MWMDDLLYIRLCITCVPGTCEACCIPRLKGGHDCSEEWLRRGFCLLWIRGREQLSSDVSTSEESRLNQAMKGGGREKERRRKKKEQVDLKEEPRKSMAEMSGLYRNQEQGEEKPMSWRSLG